MVYKNIKPLLLFILLTSLSCFQENSKECILYPDSEIATNNASKLSGMVKIKGAKNLEKIRVVFKEEKMGYLPLSDLIAHQEQEVKPKDERLKRESASSKEVNVLLFGADPTGKEDASNAMIAAHNTGQTVFYPKGRFLFTSKVNPVLSSGIRMDKDAHIDGKKYKDIVSVYNSMEVIGLQHNHLEEKQINEQITPISTGHIIAPPLSKNKNKESIALIAHWYNDFGLEKTRAGNGKNGSLTWYYWSWAHTDNPTGYDPSRHPLLGWYKGDDINVLDWQCFWLREYGISGVNLVGSRIDIDNWQHPSNKDYWKYQLFHKVKNFQGLNYILWAYCGSTKESNSIHLVKNDWKGILNDFHNKYSNYFFIKKNNKIFPVIYLFEADKLRGVFDNYEGSKNLSKFLKEMGKLYQEAGFGGLCIFARHPSGSLDYNDLENNGILYIPAGYSNVSGVTNAKTYLDYVNGFRAPKSKSIVNIVTSHESKAPHPSKWTQVGSTPQLFELLLSKAFNAVNINTYLPKVIQIYNVAEWAEGGAMLQPNMKDGFGYLESIEKAKASQKQK